MLEITWRYDPQRPSLGADPETAEEAIFLLNRGNAAFADLGRDGGADNYVIPVSAQELGQPSPEGQAATQNPFAALLGCADARVPIELVFLQPANELFVVRVAGNVLDAACVGSLDYAVNHLGSLRLLCILGHTGCGAVSATVDAYLDSGVYLNLSANLPLRAIVDSITPAVRTADNALRDTYGHERAEQPGYREALLLTAVAVNAAIDADSVNRIFADRIGEQLQVVFGVYDLTSRLVGLPAMDEGWRHGLFSAPGDEGMPGFVADVVQSGIIRSYMVSN